MSSYVSIVWICIFIYIFIGNTVPNYRNLLSSRHLLVMQNRRKKRPTSSTRCNCNCKSKQTYFAERNADRLSFKQMSTIIPFLYQKKIGIHHWADIIKYVPQNIPPLLPQRISGRLANSSKIIHDHYVTCSCFNFGIILVVIPQLCFQLSNKNDTKDIQ